MSAVDLTRAARLLHDREVPDELLDEWTAQTAAPKPRGEGGGHKALLLRCGPEWLALPAPLLEEALPAGPVHTMPYLADTVFLGLTNVGGELWPCLSLAALLGTGPSPAQSPQAARARRFLAVSTHTGRYALAVDAVVGMCPYDPDRLEPAPDTVRLVPGSPVAGMALMEGHQAGMLDPKALGQALLEALGGRRRP